MYVAMIKMQLAEEKAEQAKRDALAAKDVADAAAKEVAVERKRVRRKFFAQCRDLARSCGIRRD